ncbi:MAG: 30S ribosomal protein S6 [Dehalococcoidia bacterium]|jgi:small subunit ribosomal protein S6
MVTKENTVTEESKKLRDYELVVIISPEVAEDGIDGIVDNISQLISREGGTVDETDRWGKRKLAYPIKHFLEGYYILFRCKMKPASGKGLEASLRISEEVLRHLLVRLDS